MYGLEQDKEKVKKFAFDLEKEVTAHPKRGKEIAKQAEEKIHEIKSLLREGTNEKDFDRLGVLLHGYTALQKVLKRMTK